LIELARTQGHNIQGLSLGGGEPLLQKGLDVFLSYIDSSKVRVMVTTNLSMEISTNPVYQILKTWSKVEWMVSFDNANKEKFEYVSLVLLKKSGLRASNFQKVTVNKIC
jgi:organic radical activating enzyme